MSIEGLVLIGSLLVLIAIGVPISFTLLLSSCLATVVGGKNLISVVQRLYASNDSFPLLAIPLFYIAGELMLQGGISKRIVSFAKCVLGWLRGSLVVISFTACAFFGAISGSAFATTAAIGSLMYPEMKKEGYDHGFAAVVQASGGTLGILIPPSIPCVVYGVLTNTSIADIFFFIIPVGLFTCVVYIATAMLLMRWKKDLYKPVEGAVRDCLPSLQQLLKELYGAVWALFTPIIILGGIYSGIFTPTEAAIVAVVYSFLVGWLIYRELNPKNLFQALISSCVGSAVVMLIIDAAGSFGWLLTINNIPQMITSFFMGFLHSRGAFLLAVNVIFLIAGMFMETVSIISIMVPLMFPLAQTFGVNPIHFGIITVLNLSMGTLTPPFGGSLFVASGITKIPVSTLIQRVWGFIAAGIFAVLVVTFVPLLWL